LRLRGFALALYIFFCGIVSFAAAGDPAKPTFNPTPDIAAFLPPPLLLCDGEEGLFRYDLAAETRVPLLEGFDTHDVEPQSDGSYLVTGPSNNVALIRKTGKKSGRFTVVWSWVELNLPCVVNAVAAGKEWSGEPSLVLVSDCSLNRIFLAEAKTKDPKIRWEFKLPAQPRRVSLCRDSGNFLVSLKVDPRSQGLGEPPQVAEIDYREGRVAWSLDSKDGLTRTQDAVRDKKGRTMVTAGRKSELFCFDRGKNLLWKTALTSTSEAHHTLSLLVCRGKECLLVCARPDKTFHTAGEKPPRPKKPSGLYLVDPENGKVLAFKRSLDGGRPAPINAVSDGSSRPRPGR
jgi:hypothetical protein